MLCNRGDRRSIERFGIQLGRGEGKKNFKLIFELDKKRRRKTKRLVLLPQNDSFLAHFILLMNSYKYVDEPRQAQKNWNELDVGESNETQRICPAHASSLSSINIFPLSCLLFRCVYVYLYSGSAGEYSDTPSSASFIIWTIHT